MRLIIRGAHICLIIKIHQFLRLHFVHDHLLSPTCLVQRGFRLLFIQHDMVLTAEHKIQGRGCIQLLPPYI